jgi:hypothetical protein
MVMTTMAGSAPKPEVSWESLLNDYRASAVSLLRHHGVQGRTCTECGQPVPCAALRGAEFILEL